jgi:hypothetical protein
MLKQIGEATMSIISLILVLLLVGFLIWIVQTAPIPIHPWIKMVIMGVMFFLLLIWILNAFGVSTGIPLRL